MIFILDRQERIINILKNNGGTEFSPFFDDVLTEDLTTGGETFQFSTIANRSTSKDLVVGNFVAFKKDSKIKLFQIMQVEESHEEVIYTNVYCESAGLELINKIFRKTTINSATLRKFMETVLSDTGWNVGMLEAGVLHTLDLEIEEATVYSVLQNVIKQFECELEFRVEINNGRIASKFVDVYKSRGKVTGKRFVFGQDIEGIVRKTDFTNFYTALIGSGKNGITFKDITVDGIDKPLGQDFVADQEAFEKYNHNGYHIMGKFEFDTTSPEELLRETYKKLQEVKEVRYEYEVSVSLLGRLLGEKWNDVAIGDTVAIVDNAFNPPINLMARVSKLETSKTNPQGDTCTLTNFIEVESNISDEMRKVASELEGYVDSRFPIKEEDISNGAVTGDKISDTYTSKLTTDILYAGQVVTEKLISNYAEITDAKIENLKTKNAEIENAVIKNAEIVNAKIESLEAKDGYIENLVSKKANIEDLNSINATIENLKVKDANIENAIIDNAKITFAKIDQLEANVGKIDSVISGNISSGNIQTGGITGDNLNMETIFVRDANILDLSASKLTAGEINTSQIVITSEDGGMRLVGSTQQFVDENNRIRIQLGKDAKGDFDFYILAENGDILFNTRGITGNAIENGLIKEDMVSDGAIGGKKINWQSFTTEFNKDSNTHKLKSSKVLLDGTNQTLDIHFNGLKSTVDDNVSQTESNTTQLNVHQGKINTLIQDTTIVKDGQNLKLKDEYSKLEQTVGGLKSTVGEQQTTINQNTGKITATESKVSTLEQTVNGFNSELSHVKTTIDEQEEAINSVNSALSGKANSNDVYKKSETMTTSAINSAINQSADSIKLGISETYETKTNVETKVTTTLNSAKSYADTKKQEAISTASTDATNKVNSAKSELNTAINKKANSTDVYTKTETYTKAQTDSKIKVAKDEINLGVSSTYETKTNVESKISTAKTEVTTTAKKYADTKKAEAISTASTDATNKVNSAKNELNTAINKKANSVDVYTKSQVYTKEETNSQINVSREAIELGVKNTYETKTNVENKISSASSDLTKKIEGIQVGTRNLILNSNWSKGLNVNWTANSNFTLKDAEEDKPNSPIVYYSKSNLTDNTNAQKWSKEVVMQDVGKTEYTFSFDIKVEDWSVLDNNTIGCIRTFNELNKTAQADSEFHYNINKSNTSVEKINGRWVRISATVKPTVGKYIRFGIYMNKNGTAYFRETKAEIGNKASDWTCANEDLIDSIESKASKTDVYTKTEVYTKSETDSKISVTKQAIELGVSNTYETKSNVESKISSANTSTLSSAKSYADTKKNEAISTASSDATNKVNSAKNELNNKIDLKASKTDVYTKTETYTKSETDSKIKVAKDSIELGVSQNYETKTNVESKISSANTTTLNSAKSYADTKKKEAISTASTDATNKVNSAKNELNTAINKKANSTDVYTKTQVYTKEETNSQIKVAKNEINLGVSNTYETKTNVETKISSANTTTLNSAKSYADTKKNEAITQAGKDADSKVSTAKSELNTAINKKANSTDVYKKSETYTKAQTDSAIKVAKDEINLGVKNTYATKTDVESISIGGENIFNYTDYDTQTIDKIFGSTGWQKNSSLNAKITKYAHSNNKVQDKFIKDKNVLALTYTITDSLKQCYINPRGLKADGTATEYIELKPNTDYTLSGYVYVGGSSTVGATVWAYDDDGSNRVRLKNMTTMNWTGAFERLEFTFRTDERKFYQPRLYINAKDGDAYIGNNSACNIYNLKLEEGTKATAYSPSSFDTLGYTDEKLKSYSTTVEMNSAINVAKDSITNTVSKTYATKSDVENTYATKSSLTQTTDSITAKFESSGGYNLVENSTGFNANNFGWANTSNNNSKIKATVSSSSKLQTGYYLYLDRQGETDTSANAGVSRRFKLKPNTTYTVSGMVLSNAKTKGIRFMVKTSDTVEHTDVENRKDHTTTYTVFSGKVTSWTQKSLTFTTGASVKSGVVYFDHLGYDETDTGTTTNRVYWSQVILTEGSAIQQWAPHPNEIYSGSTIIDASGVTVNNGALRVKNNAGTTVLEGDSKGNLVLSGTLKSESSSGLYASLSSGGLTLRDSQKNEEVLRLNTSFFESNRDMNGVTFAMPQYADFMRFSHIAKPSLENGWSSSDTTYKFMDFWSSKQTIGSTTYEKGIHTFAPIYARQKIHFKNSSQYTSDIIPNLTWNSISDMLGICGDNGLFLGYRNGETYTSRLVLTEGSHPGTGDNIRSWGNWNCSGYTVHNGTFSGNHVNSYANTYTRSFAETSCIEADCHQIRVNFENIQIKDGKVILNIPKKYVGINNGYIVSSIVKKGKGDVWISSEEETRFTIEADTDIKVNIEIIIKLFDNTSRVKLESDEILVEETLMEQPMAL